MLSLFLVLKTTCLDRHHWVQTMETCKCVRVTHNSQPMIGLHLTSVRVLFNCDVIRKGSFDMLSLFLVLVIELSLILVLLIYVQPRLWSSRFTLYNDLFLFSACPKGHQVGSGTDGHNLSGSGWYRRREIPAILWPFHAQLEIHCTECKHERVQVTERKDNRMHQSNRLGCWKRKGSEYLFQIFFLGKVQVLWLFIHVFYHFLRSVGFF